MSSSENAKSAPEGQSSTGPSTIEGAVEHAKRAFALKKYEQAVDHYATALELAVEQYGDGTLEIADLYFAYGKALLENAIDQSSVLGKDKGEAEGAAEESKPSVSGSGGPLLSFSGDADDEEDEEDSAVDLFAQAQEAIATADAKGGEEDEDEEDANAEPEDDFNAAWEVLDLARTIYEKENEGKDDDTLKMKQADVYIALGDVSLETEKFDQAIDDYEAGLTLKSQLLPISSRQIAEAHYKLSIVLDLTSGRLSDSIVHAEKALESVSNRLSELQAAIQNPQTPATNKHTPDAKGKGKAPMTKADSIDGMTISQMEAEIKELEELKTDLALKVEELKTTPNEPAVVSAPALAAEALDQELKAGSALPVQLPVNDLTAMVVKKKKKPAVEKRKAEEDANVDPVKRVKPEGASTDS